MTIKSYTLTMTPAEIAAASPVNLKRAGSEYRAAADWISLPGGSGTVVALDYYDGTPVTFTASGGVSAWEHRIRALVSSTDTVSVGTNDQPFGLHRGGRVVINTANLLALEGAEDGETVTIPHRGDFTRVLSANLVANLVANGIEVLPGPVSEGGFWVRDFLRGCKGATSVPNWFCSNTGNNDAAGDVDTDPVLDIEEVLYRLGRQKIRGSTISLANNGGMYINLLSDYALKNYDFNPDFDDDAILAVLGQKIYDVPTYVFGSTTPWSDAPGTFASYSVTGAPNWTSLGAVGKYVRIESGTHQGNKGFLVKDLGSGALRAVMGDQSASAAFEPTSGEDFKVYRPTKLGGDVSIRPTGKGVLVFEACDLGIPGQSHSSRSFTGKVSFVASTIRGCDLLFGVEQASFNLCATYDCRVYRTAYFINHSFLSVGGSLLGVRGGATAQIQGRVYFSGAGFALGHADEGIGRLISNAAIYIEDYATTAFDIEDECSANFRSYVNAKNVAGANVNAFVVHSGGKVRFASGKRPAIYGTAPSGTGSEWVIGGANKTGAQVGTGYTDATNEASVSVYV
jgi:hypothetical protein